jgi:hypothetical protein
MMQNFLFWPQAFASSVRNSLLCRLLTSAQLLHALLREALPSENGRKVGQISPGKNIIFPCITAAFTILHVLQTGFVMLCSLTQGFGRICGFCSLARSFVSVVGRVKGSCGHKAGISTIKRNDRFSEAVNDTSYFYHVLS